jgi:hypothetical protein
MQYKLSFLIRRLAKEEGILPLFVICFGYSPPSVVITRAECEYGMKEYLFFVVAMHTSLYQTANETLKVAAPGTLSP